MPAPNPKATDVPAEARKAFRALRRARVATDEHPNAAAIAACATDGENPALSRRVAVARADSYYLVPGNAPVCLLTQTGSGGCSPVAQAARGDLYVSLCAPSLAAGSARLVGVMPDGVTSITVVRADGGTEAVPVQENAVVADLALAGSLPTVARWTLPSGEAREQQIPLPPNAGDTRCVR